MKKTEYAASVGSSAEDRLLELESEKMDENELPEFSREVPLSASRKDTEAETEIEYEWKESLGPSIRVSRMTFVKGAGLEDVFKVHARDGADSVSFNHRGSTYILRKTVGEVAKALVRASAKIGSIVEQIVGHIRTALGNEYVISKVTSECWAFDRRIAKGPLKCIDLESIEPAGRSRLVELIAERISELHSRNLVMGRFTLNNLLFCEQDLRLSDLRRMRVSRKRSYVVEEFKSILQYLFAIGIARREDIYAAIATYTARNEESAMEWYSERTGKSTNDPFDVAERMEREVYG